MKSLHICLSVVKQQYERDHQYLNMATDSNQSQNCNCLQSVAASSEHLHIYMQINIPES